MKSEYKDILNALVEMQESQAYAAQAIFALEQKLLLSERTENDLQAKIDALMLEYCQDEMTEAQIENWGKHQRPKTKSIELDVVARLRDGNRYKPNHWSIMVEAADEIERLRESQYRRIWDMD